MTQTLNIIIVFILITFAILMGIMSYSKAFRTNSRIVKSIEMCEGYNECSETQINSFLSNLGYSRNQIVCPARDDLEALSKNNGFDYCVYKIDENEEIQGSKGYCTNDQRECGYDRYRVVTYMVVDFPLIDRIRIPVFNITDWIYRFPNDRKL